MDAVESLGPFVPGGELVVAEGPGGGHPLLQGQAFELARPHALEHPAPDLGIPAQGVDGLGGEGIAVGAEPVVAGVIAVFSEQIDAGHVLIGQVHGPAALQQQHRAALGREGSGQGASGGAGADHDHIVVLVVEDHDQA